MAKHVAALVFLVLTIGEVITGATLPTEDNARINVRRQSSCPGSAQRRLAKCAQGMIAFVQAKTTAEKVKYCSKARKAQDCMETVLGECEIVEGTPMEQMVNVVKQSKGTVDRLCGVPDKLSDAKTDNLLLEKSQNKRCTRRQKKKMMKCITKLQILARNTRPKCRKVTKTLDCLKVTIAQCSAHLKPEIQEGIRSVGRNMRSRCQAANQVPEVAETKTCPEFGRQIASCGDVAGSKTKEEFCRQSKQIISCMQALIDACLNHSQAQMIDMKPMIFTISKTCENKEENETSALAEKNQCSHDVSKSMEKCVDPLTKLQTSPRAKDLGYVCGVSNVAFDCIDDVIARCGETDEVQAVVAVVNIDEMRSMIKDVCSGNFSLPPPKVGSDTGRCPDDFVIQLQGCSEMTQGINPSDKGQACRVSNEAMSCMTKLLDDCQHRPDVTMITRMVNLEELQAMLDKECKDHVAPTVAVETSRCTDVSKSMEKCTDPLLKLQTRPRAQDLGYVCGVSHGAFDCIDNVIARCGETEDVQALVAAVNIDQMRSMIRDMCSGNFSLPKPKDGTDTGRCPEEFETELQGCSDIIQERNPSDKAEACRVSSMAMSCMTQLLDDCQHRPEVQMITEIVNMDEIQAKLDKECQVNVTPKPSVAVETFVCPRDHFELTNQCMGPLEKLKASSQTPDLEHVCRVSYASFDCMDDVMSRCGNVEGMKLLSEAVNMNEMRAMVRDMCSGNYSQPGASNATNTGSCPDDFDQQILACTKIMNGKDPKNKSDYCSVMPAVLSCVEPLLVPCGNLPDVIQMKKMINIDKTKVMITSQCKGVGVKPTEASETGECPADFQVSLEACIEPLDKLTSGLQAEDLDYVCQISDSAFACIDNITSQCGDHEDIQTFTSLINLDYIKTTVRDTCAGNVSAPNVSHVEDSGKCPDDLEMQIQICTTILDTIDEADEAETCRLLRGALSCMVTLIEDCQHRPEVAAIERMVNVDQMTALVDKRCQEGNNPRPTVETGSESQCPGDAGQALEACVAPMNKLQSSPRAQDLSYVCGISEQAFSCIDDVMDRCRQDEVAQAVAEMIDIENMRNMIRDMCSGGLVLPQPTNVVDTGRCPEDFPQQIQQCSSLMQGVDPQDKAEACRVSMEALSCMETLLDDCQHNPAVSAIRGMVNLDNIKDKLDAECKEGNNPRPTVETGSESQCPGDAGQALEACVAPLNKLQSSPRAQDLAYVCGISEQAFSCIDDVMDRCRQDEVAQAVAEMIDIEKMRNMIRDMCSGGLVLPQPTNVVDTGRCPEDFPQQIQQCTSPMQGVDPEDKAEACRVSMEALSCMETLLDDCQHNPAVSAIRGMVNLDNIKDKLDAECSSEDVMMKDASNTNSESSNECAYEDPASSLEVCNDILQSLSTVETDRRCPTYKRGFACLRDVLSKCKSHEKVESFLTQVDVDAAEKSLAFFCE